jgi:hypothetical protein
MKPLQPDTCHLKRFASILILFYIICLLPQIKLPIHWDALGFVLQATRHYYEQPFAAIYPPYLSDFSHPPLWMYLQAATWELTGNAPIACHILSFAAAALILLLTLEFAGGILKRWGQILPLVFLISTPVFLSHSLMCYLDLPATLMTLLALHFAFRGRLGWSAVFACAMTLTKLTGLLGLPAVFTANLQNRADWKKRIAPTFALAGLAPAVTLGFWFLIHNSVAGWWIMKPGRTLHADHLTNLISTMDYLFLSKFHWVFIPLFGWSIFIFLRDKKRSGRVGDPRIYCHFILILSYVAGIGMSEFMPRYLLPMLPSFYLIVLSGLQKMHGALRSGVTAIIVIVLGAGILRGGNSQIGYDDNLQWVGFVKNLQKAERHIRIAAPQQLTLFGEWPVRMALTDPDAGYLSGPPFTVISFFDNRSKFKKKWGEIKAAFDDPETKSPTVWFLSEGISPNGYAANQFIVGNELPLEASFGNVPFKISIYRLEGSLKKSP